MAIQLTVDPKTLRNTADRFTTEQKSILTQKMLETVNSLNGSTWSGDAQKAYVNQFGKLSVDMNDIQRKLTEHVQDLKDIAQNVEKVEEQTKGEAQRLQTDFVQMF